MLIRTQPAAWGYVLLAVAMLAVPGSAQQSQPSRPPVIRHDPITIAVPRQPLTVMTRIDPGAAPIRSVTLYYTPSRDTAPIAQTMTPSDGNLYVATIPPAHLRDIDELYYYIEAIDRREEWAETPYIRVSVRGAPTRAEDAPEPPAKEKDGNNRVYWLAGGAAAIGAGVALAASGGGGGGGDDGGGGGTDDGDPEECTAEDIPGTWLNSDPTVARGFQAFADNTAVFLDPLGGPPESGAWRLVGCDLSLIPLGTNNIYRGTGTLSSDKTTVTINGNTFTKTN